MNFKFPQAILMSGMHGGNVHSFPRVVHLSHDVKQLDPTVTVLAICLSMSQTEVDHFRVVLDQICKIGNLTVQELHQLEFVCEGLSVKLANKRGIPPVMYNRWIADGNETWSSFALRLWSVSVDLAKEAEAALIDTPPDAS